MDWGLGTSFATSVITTTFITEDGHPILEVSHEDDEEGGSLWQFHSGNGDYSAEKLMLVRLDTILKIDPTIDELRSLALGKVARRQRVGGEWVIT